MSVAVPWNELADEAPELSELGRAAIYHYGPGLGYLATVRADGGPRVHPVCPAIVDERLWVLVGDSPKRRDLERDGRYALHSFPKPDVDDEFYVRELLVERAMFSKYGPRPSWPPEYLIWRAG